MSEPTLRARVSVAVGRADQLHLHERLDRLATAITEERSFLPALDAQVTELEAALEPVLERFEEED